jgi:hypothetical protein
MECSFIKKSQNGKKSPQKSLILYIFTYLLEPLKKEMVI